MSGTPAQYKHCFYLAPPQSLATKQIKTKLMLCKPQFVIHGSIKGFLKVTYMLSYKFECRSYCTIRSKQTRNRNLNL